MYAFDVVAKWLNYVGFLDARSQEAIALLCSTLCVVVSVPSMLCKLLYLVGPQFLHPCLHVVFALFPTASRQLMLVIHLSQRVLCFVH